MGMAAARKTACRNMPPTTAVPRASGMKLYLRRRHHPALPCGPITLRGAMVHSWCTAAARLQQYPRCTHESGEMRGP